MTDRERLLEILNVPIYPHENVDPLEAVADYLLDNGVTFQKWIPASEPPKVWLEQDVEYFGDAIEFIVHINGAACATFLCFDGENFYDQNTGEIYSVTHWMPLPEPPKE